MSALFADSYHLADPYRGVQWTDEISDDAAQTIAVLTAARALTQRYLAALRALPAPRLTDTWVETPRDLADRIADEASGLATCMVRIEGDAP